ncbi:MAG: hypothetical protein GXP49_11525, partial [Deltaproteobacteria bacterium]|nr:hypothetical protein [Deltaproteobacteria bacterium]
MKELALSGTDKAELSSIVSEITDKAGSLGIEQDAKNLIRKGAADRGEIQHPLRLEKGLVAGIPCFFPWFYLSVRSDGTCGPCCVASGELPNIRGKSMEDVWFGEYFERLRLYMLYRTMPDYCNRCSSALMEFNDFIRKSIGKREDVKLSGEKKNVKQFKEFTSQLKKFGFELRGLSKMVQSLYLVEMLRDELADVSKKYKKIERERAELQSKYDLLTADRDRLLFFLDQAEER